MPLLRSLNPHFQGFYKHDAPTELLQHVTPREFGSQRASQRSGGKVLSLVNRFHLVVPSNNFNCPAKELHPKRNKGIHRIHFPVYR